MKTVREVVAIIKSTTAKKMDSRFIYLLRRVMEKVQISIIWAK